MTLIKSIHPWLKAHWAAQLFVIAFLAVCLFSATADQPLHLDNMDFPAVSKQVSTTGVPVYYRGESAVPVTGLYHPPLYIYLLASWIRIFGFGETQVRMFGFGCALLLCLIALQIVRTLFGRKEATEAAPWFAAVFLLNPYTLQGSSIADIDSTIYGPLLCSILLCVLRMSWRDGERRTDTVTLLECGFLCLLIAISLWAKLTTILLTPALLPLLLFSQLGWRRSIVISILATVIGVGLFLASYRLYEAVTSLDVGYTFDFTIDSFLHRGSGGRPLSLANRVAAMYKNFTVMVPMHIRWTGSFPWIMACLVCVLSLWRGRRAGNVRSLHIGLLAGLALLTTLYYCAQTLTFGFAPFKYPFVYWALTLSMLAFLALSLYGTSDLFARARDVLIGVIAFVCALLASSRFIHDDLIRDMPNDAAAWIWHTPTVLGVAAVVIVGKKKLVSQSMFVAAVAAYVGLSLGVALHQARVSYSTTYDYGQLGFEDAVAFLRINTTHEDLIASMKDIGFAADRRYIENYSALYGPIDQETKLIDAMASGQVRYAVFTDGIGQDQLPIRPSLMKWVAENATLVRSFGHYRIYQPKAASSH